MGIDFFKVILDWKMVLITIIVIITLPIIFYFASLNKTPIKVKKVKISPAAAPAGEKGGEQTEGRKPEAKKQRFLPRKSQRPAGKAMDTEEPTAAAESKEEE